MDDLSFFYRTFVTGSSAVAFTDPEGNILDVNRGFLDLYGYKLHEVVGQNPRILKIQPHFTPGIQGPLGGHHRPSGGPLARRSGEPGGDGSEVTVLGTITSRVERGRQGHRLHRQRSRHHPAEANGEALRVKNRELEALNQIKNELMAITSHDLKAPSMPLRGYARLMRDTDPSGGSFRQNLDRIEARPTR